MFNAGQRVAYHGDGPLFDDHFKVVKTLPHGSTLPNGDVIIGERVLLDDGDGRQYAIPPQFLHAYTARCICDACLP